MCTWQGLHSMTGNIDTQVSFLCLNKWKLTFYSIYVIASYYSTESFNVMQLEFLVSDVYFSINLFVNHL